MAGTPRGPRSVVRVLALTSALGIASCRDRILPPPETPDTTAPAIRVHSPVDTSYDSDGDKLLDLHITWTDSGNVDPSSVRVRSLTGINGPATSETNLVDVWRVERLDSAGLLLHETIENLLRGGANRIEVVVSDTAGNVSVDTVQFTLPHGALFKTITTGLTFDGLTHGVDAAVCADDRRLYVSVGRRIVVVDADSLTLIGSFVDPYAFDALGAVLCVPDDPILYVAGRVERFVRPSMTWLPAVSESFGTNSIAQSRADPNILYAGEQETGGIAIVDRARAVRTGETGVPWSGTPENHEYVFGLAVLPGDSKIYFTRYLDTGVLSADPRTGRIVSRIAVGGSGWPDKGRSDDIELTRDGRLLYVAVLDGDPRGVVEISTANDSVLRTLPLEFYVPQEIALSASERRMFVTTQDRWPTYPSLNVLIDIENWRVLAEFPRPRPPGAIRFDGGVAFHQNGKLVFVAHNVDIDVYLSRE